MSDSMVTAPTRPGAILITGAGHARTDRGVPYYLRVADPTAAIVSIGFLEVRPGADAVSDYAAAGRFDFVWFTPRVDDSDPCAQFKSQLQKMNKKPN